jgi:tetratricopeptide (TPR) repeat protein
MNFKRKIFGLLLMSFVLVAVTDLKAQTAKKYFKTGEDFVEAENYEDAILQFTKAIELESDFEDAYLERAKANEKLAKFEEAAEDYNRLTAIEPKESEYFYNEGRLYFQLEEFQESIKPLSAAIDLDKKYHAAIQLRSKSYIKLDSFRTAIFDCNLAIELEKKDPENYYNRAVAYDSINNHVQAENDLKQAIEYELAGEMAYVALAEVQIEQEKYDEALASINTAIDKNKGNTNAYYVRSKIHFARKQFPEAINDLSTLLAIDPKNEMAYNQRGNYYQKLSQQQNAINDYTQAILLNEANYKAYYKRAQSYESIADYKNAVKDYESLMKLSPYDENAKRMMKEANLRLFELNREENAPTLTIISPNSNGNELLEVSEAFESFTFEAKVNDESAIEYVKLNGEAIAYDRMELNPTFSKEFQSSIDSIVVEVADVYDNKIKTEYRIKLTENDPPKIALVAPYSSDNGEVYLDSDDPNLYIEGKINDNSLIKQIIIEGATASFIYEKTNPTFSATVNVANKDEITVIAEDIYGNKGERTFTLNREAARIAANNPMGKTWVIFIENSDYESFASLDGPEKDVTMMKSAFANYEVHNIIHKKNMSKSELERFFSIELRDLIRSNRVNSILVWYAGHGKFINESGYWIPVNAKRDDEFSYFNINSLKAYMLAYSKYVTHALVVTDACESGPSFYQAMRSTATERRCDDWSATKFKSSQVFSSAGYELASDNSQFTKTFASSLTNNPDACIPIDKVVSKVTQAVAENNNQKPKFGKIAGLEDENGTFFFIRKK